MVVDIVLAVVTDMDRDIDMVMEYHHMDMVRTEGLDMGILIIDLDSDTVTDMVLDYFKSIYINYNAFYKCNIIVISL